MTNTNITNFRKNLFDYVNQAIEYNDIINVNTKSGNAVMMSEEDYRGLIETLYLSSDPKFSEALVESLDEPIEEMTNADDLDW